MVVKIRVWIGAVDWCFFDQSTEPKIVDWWITLLGTNPMTNPMTNPQLFESIAEVFFEDRLSSVPSAEYRSLFCGCPAVQLAEEAVSLASLYVAPSVVLAEELVEYLDG